MTSDELKKLGTIMGIWAHPDDETFMSGGLMAAAVKNGQTVVCATATRGEAGVQDPLRWPAETLGATRAIELIDAFHILGVTHHHWLHYRDGFCKQVPVSEAVANLMIVVEKYQPDTIITFADDGLTGHEDHKAVSLWSYALASKSKKPMKILHAVHSEEQYESHMKELDEKLNIYFNVDKPNLLPRVECDIVLDLTEDLLQKKTAALRAMPSQYAMWQKAFPFEFIAQAFASESYIWALNEKDFPGGRKP
jgi:LmbE family N-acetylglucosaminyl deacetylase